MKKLLMILLASGFIAENALACSDVNIKAKDGTVVAGRTMEWALSMGWQLQYVPKNTTINLQQPTGSKLPPVKVATKYGFAGVSTADYYDSFTDGQNEQGLSVSANFLPGFTQYESYNTANPENNILIVQAVEFILGSYATVDEVKQKFSQYSVWSETIPNLPIQATLHFLVTDKSGKSIVIEFINGKTKIFDNSIGVMTNSPNYDWHLTNIRNYLNLANQGTYAVTKEINDKSSTITSLSQGSGAIGLPGDSTSPSRFVKLTYLKNYAKEPATATEAVQQVAHILNNVDIVNGSVVDGHGTQVFDEVTQWVVLKDLKNNQLYIADYAHRTNFAQIDLNQVFKSSKPMAISINNINYPTGKLNNPFKQ